MMKIYTSYYSMVSKLTLAGIIPVGVSLSVPKGFVGSKLQNWRQLGTF